MIKTLWYMYKPGDARDYAMAMPPSVEWAKAMASQGFKLFECLVEIPCDVPLEGHGDQLPGGVEEHAYGKMRCLNCDAEENAARVIEHTATCSKPTVVGRLDPVKVVG
jgi:hypothetical protein